MANNIWSSAGSTDGNLAGNWSLGWVPTAGDTAVWDATSTVNCSLSAAFAPDSIQVSTGYTGTIALGVWAVETTGDQTWNIGTGGTWNMGSSTITCAGNFDWSGVLGTITRGTSTLVMTGTGKNLKAPYNASPLRSLYALTIQTGATITATGTSVITYGLFTLSGTLTNSITTLSVANGWTQGASGSMPSGGIVDMTGGTATFANPSAIMPATLRFRGVLGSIPAGTYSPTTSLIITDASSSDLAFTWQAGTYTFTSPVTLSKSAAGTFTISGVNNPTLIFQSNLTITQTTGTIAFSPNSTNPNQLTGTANQTINLLGKNMGTWVVNKPVSGAITWTSGDSITAGGAWTSAAAVTLPSGLVLFDANGYAMTIVGAFTASCTTLDWGEGQWTLGGHVNYAAVTTNTQSTAPVTFSGTAGQTYTPKTGATIGGAVTVNKTAGQTLTLAGNMLPVSFTLTQGLISFAGFSIVITGGGFFKVNDTGEIGQTKLVLTAAGGTLTVVGAGAGASSGNMVGGMIG